MTNDYTIFAVIEKHLDEMTDLERDIAAYFVQNQFTAESLSSLLVAEQLHVSQAALTRFAKKCGFKGYREFVFAYLNTQEKLESAYGQVHFDLTRRVLMDYTELSKMTYELVDEEKLLRIAHLIDQAKRVYLFGKGSSGYVAMEMKIRLMRLGVVCEALTESDSIAWATNIMDEDCLAIAFSLSGQTKAVMSSLTEAHQRGAKTVLFTTRQHQGQDPFTEIVSLASTPNLNYGNRISPQFPMLIMVDVLYAYFLSIDKPRKDRIFYAYWSKAKDDD